MADKAYEYMDWPRIEAIVYGEEAAPRDVMQPRVTEDGVLIQGFFPGTEAAEVLVGKKVYPMTLEDDPSEKNSRISLPCNKRKHEGNFL